MDYESVKRLGLDHYNIDIDKSFETYDPISNNHIIFIHLLKHNEIVCPLCGVFNDYINNGTKSQFVKYSSPLEDTIKLKLYRRVYICKSCGHYFKETNPFIESRQKISLFTDIKILAALKELNQTYTSVAKRFNVSPTYVINLFDRKVDLPRHHLPNVMCVDEVYSKKLSFHKYCFIIYSPRQKKIIDVLDSRHLNDLEEYFYHIDFKERDTVKYFSMDLYEPYRVLAKKCFPKAIICADSFHVIKNLTQFFHQIRIRIMKKYAFLKDSNDNHYWLFKRFWKLLSKDPSKLSYKIIELRYTNQHMTQHQIIENMLKLDDELKLAYDLIHEYRVFNERATLENAREWLAEIILKFSNSNIPEYVAAWKLLKNWHDEIINSFNKINGYRISNGPMERANMNIKTIFRLSFGSNNFTRMRNRIMYVLNSDSAILYNRKNTTNKKQGKKRGSYHK